MVLAFHQPNYLPNLGFFSKMAQADSFVVVTNLQFEKREGWQRRHKIKGRDKDIWLTVPVFGSQNNMIKDVMINNTADWQRKHANALKFTYGKTKETELLERLINVYKTPWDRLVDLNVAVILLLKEYLGISTPVLLDEEVSGVRHVLPVNVCKKYRADTYLSGMGGKAYMTDEYCSYVVEQGIRIRFVENSLTADYPYSIVHYLFEYGKDWTSNIIKSP